MNAPNLTRPKLAETVIESTVKLREVEVGRCCEVLGDTAIEYTELGDYSYLGSGCMVADAVIGRFCAIAAQVRIGAPNHPVERPSQHRFTYCPEYYSASAERDHGFFSDRRADRVVIGNDVWIGHGVIVLPGVTVGDGAVLAASGKVLIHPRSFRLTSTVHHLEQVCWRAVPIVVLITFLIGCIISQQGIFHFRRFGADIFVVDMLGVLVLREIGVLLVAIMVAGRSGSAYTAELGSMKMREEIDALRTMGFDPIEVLILPRMLALVLALPILAFLGAMAALYGGGLVAWLYGGVDPEAFLLRLRDAISIDHFIVGMVKAPVMAAVIGIVACVEGLAVQGSAESLGQHTTASVVKGIFFVIVMDGVFAIFFASIGM